MKPCISTSPDSPVARFVYYLFRRVWIKVHEDDSVHQLSLPSLSPLIHPLGSNQQQRSRLVVQELIRWGRFPTRRAGGSLFCSVSRHTHPSLRTVQLIIRQFDSRQNISPSSLFCSVRFGSVLHLFSRSPFRSNRGHHVVGPHDPYREYHLATSAHHYTN